MTLIITGSCDCKFEQQIMAKDFDGLHNRPCPICGQIIFWHYD